MDRQLVTCVCALIALTLPVSAQVPSARATGDQRRQYVFVPTGQQMPYRVYVPKTWDGKASLPIILMLHGGGANENSYMDMSGGLLPKLLPSQTGWFADEDIFQMDISDYSPAADARRFDAGTPPVPNIYGGLAGMSLIEEAGTAAIEDHVAGLAGRLIDGLEELGAVVATPRDPARRGPLVCVRSTDVHALVETLAAERITCSERDANLRISLHLYNVEDDVDRVLDALRRNRRLLAH